MRSKNHRKSIKQNQSNIEVLFLSDGVEDSEIRKIQYATSELFRYFKLKSKIEYVGSVWSLLDQKSLQNVSYKLVRIRVTNWSKQTVHDFVSPAEINFELKKIRGEINPFGIIYDGFLFCGIIFEFLPTDLKSSRILPVVITNRQVATFGEDGRYHIRIGVFSVPSIISTNGFFSAPAKPVEYHLTKMVSEDVALIKAEDLKNYIYKNIPIFARAYILEALLWNNLGVPFCSSPRCFLSDSHTTDELISTKKGKIFLCDMHKDALEHLRS